ncbi:hypothetical protein MCGE09_00541 [Thaumarchaeota archaeon SCGC AB-539-E09]|nr:hypothetical protein MCGE09_00541 [Thaumarchaeota archaeon SCGC AB-539-E09]
MDLDLDFKDTCYDCGAHNFNIWGTVISGHLNLEIRCMRCGEVLKETHIKESEALLLQDIGIFLSDD